MRCLYCGNELALLKKLTGYGEFCSEAHRQKYQEQYNRLALTRLLQAQEPELERRAPLTRGPARSGNVLTAGRARKELDRPPSNQPTAAPAASMPSRRFPDVPKPSGFLPHVFVPAISRVELFVTGPMIGPVSACLPDSLGGAADRMILEIPAALLAAGDDSRLTEPGRWSIVAVIRPLELTLARVKGSPILREIVAPFQFAAEYQRTFGDLLSIVETPALAEPDEVDQDPASANLSAAVPNAAMPASEEIADVEPAYEKPLATRPTRPPIIINYAALGEIDPDLFPRPAISKANPPAARSTSTKVFVPATKQVEEPPRKPSQGRSVPDLCSTRVVVNLPLVDDLFSPIDEARFDAPAFTIHTPPPASSPLRSKVVFGPRPVVSHSALVPELPGEEDPVQAELPAKEEHLTTAADPSLQNLASATSAETSQEAAATPDAHMGGEPGTTSLDDTESEALKMAMELESGTDFEASQRALRIKVLLAIVLAALIGTYMMYLAHVAKLPPVGSNIRVHASGPDLITGGESSDVHWPARHRADAREYQPYLFRGSSTVYNHRFRYPRKIGAKSWTVKDAEQTWNEQSDLVFSGDSAALCRLGIDLTQSAVSTYIQEALVDVWCYGHANSDGGFLSDRDNTDPVRTVAYVGNRQLEEMHVR